MTLKDTLNAVRREQEKTAKVSLRTALKSEDALTGALIGGGIGSASTMPKNIKSISKIRNYNKTKKALDADFNKFEENVSAGTLSKADELKQRKDFQQRFDNLESLKTEIIELDKTRGSYYKRTGTGLGLGYAAGVGSNLLKQRNQLKQQAAKKEKMKNIGAILGGGALAGAGLMAKEKTASAAAKARAIEAAIGATGGALGGAIAEKKTRKPRYMQDEYGNIIQVPADTKKRKMRYIGGGALAGTTGSLLSSKVRRLFMTKANKKGVPEMVVPISELRKRTAAKADEMNPITEYSKKRLNRARANELEEIERQAKKDIGSSIEAANKKTRESAFGGFKTVKMKETGPKGKSRKVRASGPSTTKGQYIKRQFGSMAEYKKAKKEDPSLMRYYGNLVDERLKRNKSVF